MDILTRIFHRITSTEKLVSGDEVLMIFYVVILITFLFDRYLRKKIEALLDDDSKTVNEAFISFYRFYRKHNYVFINIILYFICCFLMIKGIGFDLDYLLTLTLSFITFTVVLEIFLKLFIDEESYRNNNLLDYLNVVYYIIIGSYFTFFSPFVSRPGLLITFIGLVVGIIVCFYIMVRAIINPKILRRTVDARENVVSYSIIRGMLGILICIALIEYVMIYSCYITNIDFYGTGEGRVLNPWDMLYFFFISFTTIGYGDIYPQRFEGMFYSEFASIIIGVSSLFTTACFIAAVISTASSLASSDRNKLKKSARPNKTARTQVNRSIRAKRAAVTYNQAQNGRKKRKL